MQSFQAKLDEKVTIESRMRILRGQQGGGIQDEIESIKSRIGKLTQDIVEIESELTLIKKQEEQCIDEIQNTKK